MGNNDPLANVLSAVANAEKLGRTSCMVRPASAVITRVLALMKDHYYVGDAEVRNDGKGKVLQIYLLGKINTCGVIKPRYAVSKDGYEKFEKRYLPAQGMGLLIVSTAKGLMTQEDARAQELGGRLIAYVY